VGDDKHSPIGLINEFCPVPGKPCKCPQANNYRTICEPSWAGEYAFAVGTEGLLGYWEAHHVLSISCVNWLPKNAKKRAAVKRVLKVTKWCINNQKNMLAMPKFGHTIMYYTDVMSDRYYIVDFPAPPFKNIPHHDFEHNTAGGYCSEVKADISKLWDQVAEAEKKHVESKNGIKGRLDRLSRKWQDKLKARGKRCGGTHRAWKKGMKDPESNWYLPFSMANDAHAEERFCPAGGWTDKVNEKMEKIRASLRSAGAL
jgi:hypothetical protein